MFEKELSFIKNKSVLRISREGVRMIPAYFYIVPASSSGKYHPSYALGAGGLYRHVQAVVGIAIDLFKIYDFYEIEKDVIIASLILHDGWKQGIDGSGGLTIHEHPLVASGELKKIKTLNLFEKVALYYIRKNIETHMGQWTTNKNSKVILPEPKSEMQKFVHLCDYIASRKNLEYTGF